jgi:fibronectin-binding autotransporter adhesin
MEKPAMRYATNLRGRVSCCFGLAGLAAAAIFAAAPSFALAADRNWNGTLGNWSTPLKWGGFEPTSSDYAYINSGTVTVSASGETCMWLAMATGSATSGTIQMTGGALSSGSEQIGFQGVAQFEQSGGTNTVSGYLYLGDYAASGKGTYILSNLGHLNAGIEYIGSYDPNGSGMGVFTQSGGTNTALCVQIHSNSTYTLSAGTLNLNGRLANKGVWDLSNSTATINATASIVDLSHATLSSSEAVSLSLDANSLLIVPTGFEPIAYFPSYSNTGLTHQAGSTLTIPSTRSIYGGGEIADHVDCRGTLACSVFSFGLTLSGGLNLSAGGSVDLGTNGTVFVNDSTSGMTGGLLKAEWERIGSSGTGTFVQSGGTNSLYFRLYVGSDGTGGNPNGEGTYDLRGNGQLTCTEAWVGYLGKGTILQSGGTSTISSLQIGGATTGRGTYELSGAGQLNSTAEYVGWMGSGTFTQSGGTNTVSGTTGLRLGYVSGGTGTYNLTGGTLVLESLSKGTGTAAFNFGGGTLQASNAMTCSLPMTLTAINGNANVDTAGYAVALSGTLSGEGGLNKRGSGTLTLGGANSYSGETAVYVGTLSLGTTGSIDSSSLIDVKSGATFDVSAKAGGFALGSSQMLTGAGCVVGNVTAAAASHLAPGNGVGRLSITGNLSLVDGAKLDYQLGSVAGSDMILMTSSTLYLAGQDFSDFNFTAVSGFREGTYTLIDAGTVFGSLGSDLSGIVGNYKGTLSISGSDLVLTTVAVPEPGTAAFLVAAAAGILFVMRRRCASAR